MANTPSTSISTVLALYYKGMLSEKEVIAWTDKALLNEYQPFDHISLLSLHGPEDLIRRRPYDFPAPREFTFIERFALHITSLDIESEERISDFLHWVSMAVIAEGCDEIDIPEVSFGYYINHYLNDCEDVAHAKEYFIERYSTFLVKHRKQAKMIWDDICLEAMPDKKIKT